MLAGRNQTIAYASGDQLIHLAVDLVVRELDAKIRAS